ncbi:hypothetical protein [Acinetobacter sp. ANC 4178]|uniref:hypothetical protein n=1 Tax=Acinetobacter sp. ANC 4178 TaxID=2529839 RepID=UPI00103BDFC4|nr:hypothetical protein [Acinetobacter sp. ANC 4178]TCB66867.1 hypothetical protein E0H87_07460 [Acinetobacter sp. ANC 4178]
MKTNILLWAGLMLSSLSMSTLASNSDIDISRSCIKKNPLVSGENDPVLLKTYSQICDKKNADNKNGYLVQAAQRFQQIGRSEKALALVQQLEAEKVQGNTLTDVKFLAATNIANDALKQMRQKEMRYLSSDITYPAANELIRSIDLAKPASVLLETALDNAEKNQTTSKSSKKKSAKVSTTTKNKTKTKPAAVTTNKVKASTATVKVNTTNTSTNSSSNPFAGL